MKYTERFMIKPGQHVHLAHFNPDDTGPCHDKSGAEKQLAHNVQRLAELQQRFYAEARRALLIIIQGMDASGKDGTIRHVMSGLNPQSCRVTSFKAPSALELAHDFLWRIHQAVPGRGEIGIFNRSHYEDVLVVRVHNLLPEPVWSKRYQHINNFERMLTDEGVVIRKFFLHISKHEQLKRLQQRLQDPGKNWKFNRLDLTERKHWHDYMRAYETALARCSTEWAPWFVIPSNKKWFRNLAVSAILVETLEELNPRFPPPNPDLKKIKLK
ncbi:MAG: polyphosphate kinase 2 family protein [Verrucomicrobiae bacterium]|nr:polyphosphate kinase 2 family protein [Verrucomicrobiae bacterium]